MSEFCVFGCNSEHDLDCPIRGQQTRANEIQMSWRNLALQFDNHRMQALAHLRLMTQNPLEHLQAALLFLTEAPLSGEVVLEQRLAELAAGDAAPVAVGYVHLVPDQYSNRYDVRFWRSVPMGTKLYLAPPTKCTMCAGSGEPNTACCPKCKRKP